MDEIIANINSPAWWFDGLFFTSFVFLVGKLARFASNFARKTFRLISARRLRKIKKIRGNYFAVNYEIGKVNSFFILFLLICCFYLIWFVIGSLSQIVRLNILVAVILLAPIYVSEVVWLLQDAFTKELIERSHRIGAFRLLHRKDK
ncbi:hypothetical protein [Methylomonas rosea]|uniref:Glycosyl-4,4'-diaponeurosporenoate acyltransferase n=1 Tax=Methylomonas rosea TaxID=2952227 RepID=A0ABT1TMW8_9GAMM|nr:hypothetical protein [Methylomonas sp. WSC-7]MCQ8115832.1 hypothetical protein [Methylomonas sp. WSC-7]